MGSREKSCLDAAFSISMRAGKSCVPRAALRATLGRASQRDGEELTELGETAPMGTFKRAEWFNRFNESGSGRLRMGQDLAEMVEPSNPKLAHITLHPGSLRFAGAKASAMVPGGSGTAKPISARPSLCEALPRPSDASQT